MSRPLIIGHRGFAAAHGDNTPAGVASALAAGADGVEVDVRPCAEGVWVCHHDLRREGRPIGEWGLEALRRVGVPALAEILALVPDGRWLYVEVKPLAEASLAASLTALAELLWPRAECTRVISASLPVLSAVEAVLPRVARSWVLDALPDWLPNEIELSPKHTLVEALADTGRALHPWTVDRPARMRSLAALGVASLTTNRPDLAIRVLDG